MSTTGFKDNFSAHAADYASFRPVYPLELVDYLAGLVVDRSLVLDCGCGTGQLSTLLAERFAKVLAIDASAELLAQAAPRSGVEYQRARAEETGLVAASVDLVTVAQAVHWFDLEAFYAEVRRVLKPGGPLALISYGGVEIDGSAGELLDHFRSRTIGPYWPPERKHVESGYRDLPFPFVEGNPPALVMTARWNLDELLGYVETWSALRKAEEEGKGVLFVRFREEIGAAWGERIRTRTIRWPLRLRVGRVA